MSDGGVATGSGEARKGNAANSGPKQTRQGSGRGRISITYGGEGRECKFSHCDWKIVPLNTSTESKDHPECLLPAK